MNNTGVIDHFLDVFTRYIDSGFGLLSGDVQFLSATLIGIDITLAGLFWAMAADEDVIARLIKKTLYIGFFAFIIGNFNSLCRVVFESFSELGLKAAGSALSSADFLRPGKLAQVGIDAGKPLLEAASGLMGYVSFFQNFVQIFVLLVAWVVVVVAFFILAVQLFITLIEFKLTTLAGFVLIPFALFKVASGVKILVLAVIVGIGTSLFSEFTQGFGGNQPTIEDALAIMLAALSLFGLGIFAPSIAAGLVSGAPQLGAGAAVGTALAAGGLGVAGAMGARSAAGIAGSAMGAGARGVGSLAGMSPASASASSSSPTNAPPNWAQRLHGFQTMKSGASTAAHAVRAGDHGGGSNSVPLNQDDR